ncbi:MAG TPA: nucleotide exchange factor GrpE [Solirubrobacteraceae bacterium]|jgi:molecular chaperone GrpE|nr:nucleotide exchange factor GrpE [Solirubrobacteraceae bacterium]
MSDSPQTVDRAQDTAGSGAGAQQGPAPGAGGASAQADAAKTQARERSDTKDKPSTAPGAAAACGDAGAHRGEHAHADEGALAHDVDELVAVAAQRDEYLALAQRTQADFENYRKRVAKEAAAAQERGVARLAQELLPALDNLDRALEAAAEHADGEASLLEGMRLVSNELHAALARMGIERFSPKGKPFDPAEHEAMAQQPVAGAQSGTVAEVFAPGYRLGKNVIRPARVLVAA